MPTQNNLTLKDAIHKADQTSLVLHIWSIDQNILEIEIPKHHTFESILVVWRPCKRTFTVFADLPATNKASSNLIPLNKERGKVSGLENLQKNFPKLFEVTGNLRIVC